MKQLRESELIALIGGEVLPAYTPTVSYSWITEVLALLEPSRVPQHLSD